MGINSFSKFFSDILQNHSIYELKNKIVIVDTIYIIYKYCIAIRNTGKDYVNKDGNLSSHLLAIFNLATFLLKNKITPIFVFDGRTPDIKKKTTYERKKKKIKASENINNENNEKNINYIKNFKKSFHLEDIHYLECQLLLNALGITYINSPEEADSQCAVLSHIRDKIGGIISEDSDILVFGGQKLIKNFNIKNKTYDEYDLDSIINFMIEKSDNIRNIYKMPLIDSLTHKDFITYCILLGNDYIDNLKYFKYDKIFEYLVINDFKIDKFLNHIKNIYLIRNVVFNIEDYLNNYLIKFDQVYNYYINAKVFDPLDIQYNKNDIDINMIEKIMCEYHNFDKNIINHELTRLKKIPQLCASQEPPIYNGNNNFFALLDSYD
jgi:flap endonuclease-1